LKCFLYGRGNVLPTGVLRTGVANTGDPVEIIGMGAEKLNSTKLLGLKCSVKLLEIEVKLVDNVW